MKVYVVEEIDWESTEVIGIFDNKEKAKEVQNISEKYSISVYTLNELTEYGKKRNLAEIKGFIKN